jgi:hypothetical protein
VLKINENDSLNALMLFHPQNKPRLIECHEDRCVVILKLRLYYKYLFRDYDLK